MMATGAWAGPQELVAEKRIPSHIIEQVLLSVFRPVDQSNLALAQTTCTKFNALCCVSLDLLELCATMHRVAQSVLHNPPGRC